MNKVVSEGSQIIELPGTRQEIKVEIKAMASATLRIHVHERKGPIRIQLSFQSRGEGDKTCLIHRDRDIGEDAYTWCYKNKQTMTVYPKKAWSIKATHPKDKSAQA